MGMSYECQIYVKYFDIYLTVQPWLTFKPLPSEGSVPTRKKNKKTKLQQIASRFFNKTHTSTGAVPRFSLRFSLVSIPFHGRIYYHFTAANSKRK